MSGAERGLRIAQLLCYSVTLVALISVVLAVPIAVQKLHRWQQRRVYRPSPRSASQVVQLAVVHTLLTHFNFIGLPPPPPPPGSDWQRIEADRNRKYSVLPSDKSTRFCADSADDLDCERPWMLQAHVLARLRKKVPEAMLLDLHLANLNPRALSDPFLPNASLMSAKKILLLNWQEFFKSYPDASGALELSQAVISADGSHALICSALECGPLCGSGKLHYFQCVDRSWKLLTTIHLWSS